MTTPPLLFPLKKTASELMIESAGLKFKFDAFEASARNFLKEFKDVEASLKMTSFNEALVKDAEEAIINRLKRIRTVDINDTDVIHDLIINVYNYYSLVKYIDSILIECPKELNDDLFKRHTHALNASFALLRNLLILLRPLHSIEELAEEFEFIHVEADIKRQTSNYNSESVHLFIIVRVIIILLKSILDSYQVYLQKFAVFYLMSEYLGSLFVVRRLAQEYLDSSKSLETTQDATTQPTAEEINTIREHLKRLRLQLHAINYLHSFIEELDALEDNDAVLEGINIPRRPNTMTECYMKAYESIVVNCEYLTILRDFIGAVILLHESIVEDGVVFEDELEMVGELAYKLLVRMPAPFDPQLI